MFRKSLSVLLAVVMVLSVFSILPASVSAQEAVIADEGANIDVAENGYTAHTQSEAVQWAWNQEGNTYDLHNGYGYQCVNLIRAYYEYLGVPLPSGNADSYLGDYNNHKPDGWTINWGTSGMQAGDIMVYTGKPYGHVAIVLEIHDSYCEIMQQNADGLGDKYTEASKCHSGTRYYSSISGYIHPDFGGNPEPDYTPVNILSGVYVIHSAWDDNIVLDIAGDSKENDANIQLYQRVTTNDVQKFRIIRYNDYYCIKSVYSDLWLDVKLPIGDNSNVKLYYDNSNEENDWQFIDAGDGYYYIRNRTGYYLDVQGDRAVNHANIQLYHFVGTNSQKWRLEDVTKYVNAGGVCKIRSSYNNNMCLDIAGNSKENRANIQLYENTNDDVQKFRIYKVGNFTCFKSVFSGNWLDISLPIENKANVQLWQSNDSDEEKWIFEDAGNGYVYIQSKTGYYLDLEYDDPVNRANIQIYRFTGNNSQRWKIDDLTYHTPVEEGIYTIHSAWNENMCLDIEGNSTENRANVILYQYENTNMQKYRIYKFGEYYGLKSIHADKWLDIKTPFGNNSNVQLWSNNSADEEYWVFEDAGNGYVYIRSKLGYYLDLQGDNPVNWANIQIYNFIGSNSQKWKLKRVLESDMITVQDVVLSSTSNTVDPDVTVKVGNKVLTKGTDYTVAVSADVVNGKGTVTITGQGNYSGSVTKKFSISVIVPTEPTTPTEPPTTPTEQPTTPTEPKTIILGDVDGDGEVTIIDATCIQRHLASIPTASYNEKAADADGDGSVTIIDATAIQRHLAQLLTNENIGKPIA